MSMVSGTQDTHSKVFYDQGRDDLGQRLIKRLLQVVSGLLEGIADMLPLLQGHSNLGQR